MVDRYGGEEFALLLPQTAVSEALMIAERLRKGVAELSLGTFNSAVLPRVTVSIGIAKIQTGDTLEKLLDKADAALYQAKKNGRNCISK